VKRTDGGKDFPLRTLRCSFAPSLVIPKPDLSARNLLFASSEQADSSRDSTALRNDNSWRILKLHHYAKIALMLAASWLLVLPVCTAESPVRQEQIDHIFEGLKSDSSPGLAVLVIKNGEVVFSHGYGIADLRTKRQINTHTNFRLASCTKQFTAMAVMLLVRDGKLHYEDRLTDIFPDFPEYGKSITIRNLLNHTSGLLDYEDLMAKPAPGTRPEDIPQIKDAGVLALLKHQKTTKFPSGTKWDYSNSGYAVLAMVVEKISGHPFGDFLHARIFTPLGMTQTVAYEKGKNTVANRAYGHTHDGGAWIEQDQSPTSAVLGDGGVYSSLDDLAKWDRALAHHTLLSEEEMKPAITPVAVADGSVQEPDGKPAAYGFGWFLNSYRSRPRMWHYGETVGFRTTIQRFVDDKLTVIVLCNRDDVVPANLALKVADLFLSVHH
jgi:CubicO group peptidase (beta-lactamase class C family)